MVLLNPLICPIGRNLWLRFAFFVFLRTWVFQLPEMQPLRVQLPPFWHALTHRFCPDPDWLATCENYLSNHPGVGACYARLVSHRPNRILTRWRMRFLERRFGEQSGPSQFAPGHAVLFRNEVLDLVGGYDVRYRRHHEDSDICQRMCRSGWER